ncbi:MAG: hypothetical protein AABW79_04645 [Nanoarchaeota archaeon]
MLKRANNFVVCATLFQVALIVSFSIAISFLIAQTIPSVIANTSPAVSVVPVSHVPTYTTSSGPYVFDIDFGKGSVPVKWTGTNPETGIANGILADGTPTSWKSIPNSEIAQADITNKFSAGQLDNWGKTTLIGGKSVANVDFLGDPNKFGLVRDGQLTPEGIEIAEKAGIKNPAIDPTGAIVGNGESYSYSLLGYQITSNFFLGHLIEGASWALFVVGAIQLVGGIAGLDPKLTNTLSIAAASGIIGGKAIYGLFGQATPGLSGSGGIAGAGAQVLSPLQAGLIGIGIAAIVFVLLYKDEKKKVVTLQCLPWEAPLGGSKCEQCNGDPLKPCSEYRCKSLGQACEIVNKGTAEERCVWVARNDVSSATIEPWAESLKPLNQGLRFTPDSTIRPPNRGVKIVSNKAGGCVMPFTPLEFGIRTNEPTQCKIDTERPNGTTAFDSMQFYFGDSNYYAYNHTQTMRLPSPNAIADEAGLELENNGAFNYFVRCRDANGNENVDDFVINFCVDKSPDTTPPVIESTSINSGSPVGAGVQNLSLGVYVNEPSQCKWSIQDKNYNDMENTMSCVSKIYQQNAKQLYPCVANLNGIKDRATNTFYFRCKDQPLKNDSERNVNSESYVFILKGSQALNIIKTSPNSTITGSTDVVPVNLSVETSNGAEEGKAICYFSPTGVEGSYVLMFQTNSYKHTQILSLTSGNYNYRFRCVDAGGNAAESSSSFNVLTDRQAPFVTRVYREGTDALKVVTNEDAECTYSTTSCNYNFAEGLKFIYNPVTTKNQHFARWESSKTYYIKCKDGYDNQPAPNACSVIASATNVKQK